MKAKSSLPNPSQFKITLGLTKYALLATLRNKSSVVFSLIFPLVFVLVFGAIGNSTTKINIGVANSVNQNNAIYKAVKQLADSANSPISLTTGSTSDLEKQLSQSKIDSVLEPETSNASTSLKVVTTGANPAGGAAAQNIINGITSQMNFQAATSAAGTNFKAPFTLQSSDIAGRTFRYIDFALPGQIGFSLLSLATFGVAFSLIALRRTLVLKRIFATSVRPLSFVISQCLSRSVQAIFQAAIIIGVGVAAFHFQLANGWVSFVEILLISGLGVLCFLGFGILVSNIAKDEQSAPIALNLFNLPQLLLSGVFFSTDGMPIWVQKIGNNLPLSYFNIAIRKIATEGAGFRDIYLYLLGMIAWGIFAYILAARTFKAE